jgi:hypothetical protein
MPSSRKQSPFWRRHDPPPGDDIALLRPAELPKAERFETRKDARQESERSGSLLTTTKSGECFAEALEDCREEHQRCNKPFCPVCARDFRRWFTGELLQITKSVTKSITILTVLLGEADRGRIDDLDPAAWQHRLQKRLRRRGLGTTPVIGGFEVIYRAREKMWVLHTNLMIIDGDRKALEQFKTSFSKGKMDRPVFEAILSDAPKQLSYLLKFGTYHRPFQQQGSAKSPPKPLNAAEHHALVQWMAKRNFKDMMFLFNARRQGSRIRLKNSE